MYPEKVNPPFSPPTGFLNRSYGSLPTTPFPNIPLTPTLPNGFANQPSFPPTLGQPPNSPPAPTSTAGLTSHPPPGIPATSATTVPHSFPASLSQSTPFPFPFNPSQVPGFPSSLSQSPFSPDGIYSSFSLANMK